MVKPFYKPLDRPEREEIWYCYLCSNKGKQDIKDLPNTAPISQVPDLTAESMKVNTEQQKGNRRRQLQQTDSKYLRLAKTGGRKNLLCYLENERRKSEPKPYKVPEWYYHDDDEIPSEQKELSEEEKHKKYKVTYGKKSYKTQEKPKIYERPDYMTHLEPTDLEEIPVSLLDRIPDRPIFGYDSFSFWKRDELEKSNKLPSLVPEVKKERRQKKPRQTVNISDLDTRDAPPVKSGKRKNVKLPVQGKTVSMSGHRKLASCGYATKWYEKWYVQAIKNCRGSNWVCL